MDLSPDEENFPGRLLHQAALWDNVELLSEPSRRDAAGRRRLAEGSQCLRALLAAVDAACHEAAHGQPNLRWGSGYYHWKPRLDIAFTPNKKKVKSRKRFLVLINGYSTTITFLALAHTFGEGKDRDLTLNPASAFFYTNAYRWALRYVSMLPKFISGSHDLVETHRVWEKRFDYMRNTVPYWMQKSLFFVDDWDKVETDMEKYKKYSEKAFIKHYRYPSRKFNNFASEKSEIPKKESKDIVDSYEYFTIKNNTIN